MAFLSMMAIGVISIYNPMLIVYKHSMAKYGEAMVWRCSYVRLAQTHAQDSSLSADSPPERAGSDRGAGFTSRQTPTHLPCGVPNKQEQPVQVVLSQHQHHLPTGSLAESRLVPLEPLLVTPVDHSAYCWLPGPPQYGAPSQRRRQRRRFHLADLPRDDFETSSGLP